MKKRMRSTFRYTGPSQEEQTKMSWATLLNGYEEVPEDYHSFYAPLKQTAQPFPYSVLTPSFEGFLQKFRQRVICLIDQSVYIIDKNETVSEALRFNFSNIDYLCYSSVLLDSNLHISGVCQAGQHKSVELRFNTVSDTLFKPIVRMIRQANFCAPEVIGDFDFDDLESESFKFANFCRHCLLPGEGLNQLIWQPELRIGVLHSFFPSVFDKFLHRVIFPNHALMLTNQELIIIKEDEQNKRSDRFGGIWEFIPLPKIKAGHLTQEENGVIQLTITLKTGLEVHSLFMSSMRQQLENLLNLLNQLSIHQN